LKLIKKAFIIIAVSAMLSGCSFQEIKSDKDILTSENQSTTTTLQVLGVPDLTTTTPPITNPSGTLPGEDDPEVESPYPCTMITTANVNARKGPSTADTISQTVIEGTEVKVIGYADGWYQVDIDGETLYIIEDYLEEVSEE